MHTFDSFGSHSILSTSHSPLFIKTFLRTFLFFFWSKLCVHGINFLGHDWMKVDSTIEKKNRNHSKHRLLLSIKIFVQNSILVCMAVCLSLLFPLSNETTHFSAFGRNFHIIRVLLLLFVSLNTLYIVFVAIKLWREYYYLYLPMSCSHFSFGPNFNFSFSWYLDLIGSFKQENNAKISNKNEKYKLICKSIIKFEEFTVFTHILLDLWFSSICEWKMHVHIYHFPVDFGMRQQDSELCAGFHHLIYRHA